MKRDRLFEQVILTETKQRVDLTVHEPPEITEARRRFEALGVPYTYAMSSGGYDPATDSYILRVKVTPHPPRPPEVSDE